MAGVSQSYANHRRWLVPWHFIAFPILAINVIVEAIDVFQVPTIGSVWQLLVAIALVLTIFTARNMAITNQDRIIRDEERLRLARLMPGREAEIDRLSIDQLIGIRFASDAEAPGLVDRALAGELPGREDIKKQIKDWRADTKRV